MSVVSRTNEIIKAINKRDYTYKTSVGLDVRRKNIEEAQTVYFDFYLQDYRLLIDVEGSNDYLDTSGYQLESTIKAKAHICKKEEFDYLLIGPTEEGNVLELIKDKISEIVKRKYEPYP